MSNKSLVIKQIAFLLFPLLLNSQEALITDWEIIEASPIEVLHAEAWGVGTDQEGNIFWGPNMDMPGSEIFLDARLFKIDQQGNILWRETIATGPYSQQTYHLVVTDSIVYSGGRTCADAGLSKCDVLFSASDINTGETKWSFTWDGGFGYEEVDGIHLDQDGIYLTGWTHGGMTAEMDVLLMKIDYAGNLIWESTWSSAGRKDDHQDGHVVVDDSMIYVSGLYGGSPLLGFEGQILLAKFDKTNGELVDSVLYGRQDFWINAENALGMASDGTFLYVVGYTTVAPNNRDIFLAKFDKDLNEIWYTTWGWDGSTESARAIALAPDGSIYIGGNTKVIDEDIDAVLIKFNPSGEPQWYKTWAHELDDNILDIHLNDNNLYITGRTNSFHPLQKLEAFLIKTTIDSSTALSSPTLPSATVIHFSPNPMTQSATLEFENPKSEAHQLNIYDISGRLIHRQAAIRSDQVTVDKMELGNGLFVFELWNEKGKVGLGKLVVQ